MKFRKKPVVIEAFQMTKERRTDAREWPRWLDQAWNVEWPKVGALSTEDYPIGNGTVGGTVLGQDYQREVAVRECVPFDRKGKQ